MKLDPGYYGDAIRWFVGTVISNQDPLARGRVQIRIHGIHSNSEVEVPSSSLPWAETMLPTTEGGVSGIGKIPQILNSAFVFGIFLDGEISQTPLVMGSLSHKEVPSAIQQQRAAANGDFSLLSPTAIGPGGLVTSDTLVRAYNNGEADVDTRRLILMSYLINNNIAGANSRVVAAAIVGNLEADNGSFDPTYPTEATWGASRLQSLRNYAQARRVNYDDFFIQAEFIFHEMKGAPITNNDGAARYALSLRRLEQSNLFEGGEDPQNATWVYFDSFNLNGRADLFARERLARAAYEQYQEAIVNAGTAQ